MKDLKNNIEFFNIGDIISVFTIREENVDEELYFIGLVTEKNLKHNSFKIMAHPLIEMKFSIFSPFIVQINLLKKQALNFLQYKKKKKKIIKILKKKKDHKKFKYFNNNIKKNFINN